MHALLSLSSYVHSVETPSSAIGKHRHSIAETVIRHFVASLVITLTIGNETSEELRGIQANIWDLKFLRRLLTLWTSDRDGLSSLDELIERLQVCGPPKCDKDIYLASANRSLPAVRLTTRIPF